MITDQTVRLVWRLAGRTDRIALLSSPGPDDQALAMAAGLRSLGRDDVWLLRDSRAHPPPDVSTRSRSKRGPGGPWALATAGTVITTHGMPWRPHPAQTWINAWHGMPIKPIGKLGPRGQEHRADFTLATSDMFADLMARSMGVDRGTVRVTGLPRNDRMVRTDREDVLRRLHCRRLVLHLPTVRTYRSDGSIDGSPSVGAVHPAPELVSVLEDHDTRLVCKLHPDEARRRPRPAATSERVVHADDAWLHSRGVTLYQALGAADVLVSDISSAIIDFTLVDRPIVHHFPDHDEYLASRGSALGPFDTWRAGPATSTVDELASRLDAALSGHDVDGSVRRARRADWHDVGDDGRSSERVARLVGRG